jgi:2-phospho-L-lactate guanylyltransferase
MSERASAVWAVVPVKGFARGKSRLGSVLTDSSRAEFARELFAHVTGVLHGEPRITGVLVLTDDDTVAEAARGGGLAVLRDSADTLSEIVDGGLREVQSRGASAALVCMADLPRLRAADVVAIVDALTESEVVVVPDLEAAGTNALCMAPPTRMPSCFGHADSFQRHMRATAQAGAGLTVLRLRSVCFDVDGPEDLQDLQEPSEATTAPDASELDGLDGADGADGRVTRLQ